MFVYFGKMNCQDKRYWFGPQLTTGPSIVNMMNQKSCFRNGYKLVCGNVARDKTYIKCERYAVTQPSKATTNKMTKSSRPSRVEERCDFSLTIQYDHFHKQMFLRQCSGCNLSHFGHFVIPPEHRLSGTKDLPEVDLGKLSEFMSMNFPTNVIQDFIEFETGQTLSMSAIRSFRRTVLKKSHDGKDMTPAESLLHFLDSVEGLEYKILTGTYDEASDCVSVRQTNKKSGHMGSSSKGEIFVLITVCLFEYSTFFIIITLMDIIVCLFEYSTFFIIIPLMKYSFFGISDISVGGKARSFIKTIIQALEIGSDEFLLGVAWITKEGKVYHKKFPWINGWDVTFGTNAEKRPLGRLTHKTANNNIFPGVQAFLPSQAGWVFDWIKSTAVPQLLCTKALEKTSLELTDEDRQYIHVSRNVHANTDVNPYGNSKIRLCKWHKVSPNVYCLS
jgi:hypothetical protein